MQQTIVLTGRGADLTTYRYRYRMQRFAEMRSYALAQIARDLLKFTSDDTAGQAQKVRRIRARLNNDKVGFTHDEQRTVRLDRTGQLICSRSQFDKSACPNAGSGNGREAKCDSPRNQSPLFTTASTSPSSP